MGYFFKNSKLRDLCDFLSDRLSLKEEQISFSSDVHDSLNCDYVEALRILLNPGRKLTLTYSSTVLYSSDDEREREFEPKKADLDEKVVDEYLASCDSVEEPIEWLRLMFDYGSDDSEGTKKMTPIFNVGMDPYSADKPLNFKGKSVEESDNLHQMAEEELKKHGL